MGAVAVGEDEELAALWRTVDDLSAELAPADRRAVRNAIANNVLSGWHPSVDDITRLVDYAAGKTSMADYLTHVTATARREHF
jgi:hypothetical protein